MKKSVSTIIILIILLCIFGLFVCFKNSGAKVIKIITPTKIIVDLNRNNIFDEGEIICVPEISTFTSNILENQDNLAKALKINNDDSIKIGYLTDEYAKSTLENKQIKLQFYANHSSECKFADIIVDNKSYAELLKQEGFAIKNNTPINLKEFQNKLVTAKKLSLVLANIKSGKYHEFNCKYGKNSSDFAVLPINEAELKYEKCKYCIKSNTRQNISPKTQKEEITQITPYETKINEIFKDENITFIVSDFTKVSKPSRECQHNFCKQAVRLINSAQNTLDIAAYGWAEIPEIKNAINNARHRGVKIRLVYDKRNGKEYYPETTKIVKIFENAISDENKNNKTLTSMLMHNKFIISDNKTVYTGSMNFSTTGFSGFNANNVIIINSEKIANLYTAEFEQMYSGKFHTEKVRNTDLRTANYDNTNISAYFSPKDKVITKRVIPLITQAKKYIYIPAFVITHNDLTNAIIEAKNRGVSIKIITDATSSGTTHSKNTKLRESGVALKYENFAGKLHNKSIIIDDEIVITGSMNFSNSGENKNDENCLIIENKEIAKFYREYFEYLWAKIPDKWLYNTIRAESKDSINSCDDGIDNDYDGKTDIDDSGCF